MKANLLKLQRRHPLLFEIFYSNILRVRSRMRLIEKCRKILQQKADEFYGWEDDREAYDACIIAIHYLQSEKERLQYEFE